MGRFRLVSIVLGCLDRSFRVGEPAPVAPAAAGDSGSGGQPAAAGGGGGQPAAAKDPLDEAVTMTRRELLALRDSAAARAVTDRFGGKLPDDVNRELADLRARNKALEDEKKTELQRVAEQRDNLAAENKKLADQLQNDRVQFEARSDRAEVERLIQAYGVASGVPGVQNLVKLTIDDFKYDRKAREAYAEDPTTGQRVPLAKHLDGWRTRPENSNFNPPPNGGGDGGRTGMPHEPQGVDFSKLSPQQKIALGLGESGSGLIPAGTGTAPAMAPAPAAPAKGAAARRK